MSRRPLFYILFLLGGLSVQTVRAQVDFTTLSNKVMTGYQGWHWCKGDLSPRNNWNHWIQTTSRNPGPDNCHMDAFPDMTEYTKQYNTDFYTPGGTRMKVYSAVDYSTVDLHFKWMRDYNIDGAFVQRFVSRFKDPNSTSGKNTDIVLTNCQLAAEAYGRSFVVMYDVSDKWTSDAQLYNTITYDWINRAKSFTNSPNYQYHNGKPLAVVWGMGKTDRWPESPKVAMDIVNFFKTNGCTLMGGVGSKWRTLSGMRTNEDQGITWAMVNDAYDVISPWLVGTFGDGISAADGIRGNLAADVQDCNSRGVDYMPVVFPGFSWANWQPGATFNSRRRLGGEYLWRQAYNAKTTGSSMLYLAMFDEVDEATALYKTTPNEETSPQVIYASGYTNRWVRLDLDGYSVPSDWYLQVCGEINRMFKGERTPVGTLPLVKNTRPVVTSTPVTNGTSGTLYSYALTAVDAQTNAMSYTAVTLPAWLSFNTNTAVLSGTPSAGDIGSHEVALRVSDFCSSTNQSFTVWVGTAGNDVPLITSTPNTGVIENQVYIYTISAIDMDGDPLTYSAPVKPAWLSFNPATRILSGTPASTNQGLNYVALTVYDGTVTVTQQFNIAVFTGSVSSNLVQNGSFELGGTSPSSWLVGSSTVGSTEQAQEGSASLKMMTGAGNTRQTLPLQLNTAYQLSVRVLASGLTSGGARFDTNDKFDEPSGPFGPGGTCQFNIEVGDAQVWTKYTGTFNSSNETSVTIRTYQSSMVGAVYFDNVVLVAVTGVNTAPVITSVPETRVNQDTLYSYTLLAADTGTAPLVFTGVTIPSWLSFNTNSGVLNGTPTAADPGSHLVTLRVSDGLLTDEQSFSIEVVQTGSGYTAWAAAQSEPIGAPDVDHDSDGRNNLYEYALNGNPTDDEDNGMDPVLVKTDSGVEYIHLQRNDDTNLIYTVETRTNLLSGVWTTNGISVLGTAVYNAEYDEITYGISTSNVQSYIRLKIEN